MTADDGSQVPQHSVLPQVGLEPQAGGSRLCVFTVNCHHPWDAGSRMPRKHGESDSSGGQCPERPARVGSAGREQLHPALCPGGPGGTCGVQALPGRSTRSAQLKCHTQYPCSQWLGDALQRAKPKAISARSSSLADTGRRSHGSVQTSGNRGQIPPQTATQVSLRPSQRQGLPAVGPAMLQGRSR